MAAPTNSAESDKAIEESQEMTCCSIPPPPIDFSSLSPYPWSPTDLPWSPSCVSQSATEPPLPFSQLPSLPILPSDQSIKIPQFQQQEDTVFNEIISSLCLQLQNMQLLPKTLHKVSPQQQPDLLAQLLAQQLLPQLPPQQLSQLRQLRQLEKLEVLLLLDLLLQLRQLLLQLPLVQMPLLLWLSLLLQQMPQQLELLMLQLGRSQQQPLSLSLQQPQLLQSMRLPQLLQQSLQQKLQQLPQLPRLQQLLQRQQWLLQFQQPHRLQQLLQPLLQLLWQLPQQQSQRQSQQQLQLLRPRMQLPHRRRRRLHPSLLLPPLFLQSKSDALNLSPTFLNMGMNIIEHISWGLFRTPALPPIIKAKPYKGVWQRQDGEWVAKIRHHRKWFNIGTFNTAEEAAVAHDRAAYMLRGRLAQINFPELVGVSHSFLDKNRAEPTAATIMEILSPPTQQEDNPGEDSVLWWRKATKNDEIEAVDIEGEETREDEMNSGLEKGKRKVMIAGEERETKKSGVRITIPLEDIQQRKEMSIKDAAMDLKVSKSTLKRVCRDYGIPRWPPRENNKLTSNSLPSKSPATTDQEEILRLNYDILPPNQALPIIDTNSVTIKARPENGDTIKFRLSSPWRKVELEHQVERRLELKAGTYSVKYKDQDNDLILIGCDDDMEDCISCCRSIGVSSIEVFLEPKKPI